MTDPASSARLAWWLRLPLAMLPAHVREEHERELVQLIAALRVDGSGGHPARRWIAMVADVLAAAPRAHWDVLRQDVRFAIRQLARAPGVALTVIVTLAIGIAGTATLFTLVDGVLLRPLPYRDASQLVDLTEQNPAQGWRHFGISPANFRDFVAAPAVLASATAYYPWSGTITVDEVPDRVRIARVDGQFFRTFADRPTLGRPLGPDDDVPGVNVIVVSDRFWRATLGADPTVIGQSVTVDGVPHRVVGVMPPAFEFPAGAAIWKPLAFAPSDWMSRDARYLFAVGRLAPGVTVAAARAALETTAGRLALAYAESNRGWTSELHDLRDAAVGAVRAPVLLLFGAAVLVLLIAIANVANLLLSRAIAREREMALRSALGARSGRLVRQLLTEGIVLAVAAGGVGLAIAAVTVIRLRRAGAIPLPGGLELTLGGSTVLFTGGLVLLVGIAATIWPARAAARRGNWDALRDARGGTPRGRRRWQRALVVVEVSLAAFVLVAGALVVRTVAGLLARPLGFVPAGGLTFRIEPPWHLDDRIAGALQQVAADRDRAVQAFRRLTDGLAAVPGTHAVGAINRLPLTGDWWNTSVDLADRPAASNDRRPTASLRVVTPGYFAAVGTRILRGRAIGEADVAGAEPVVVIDENFARENWGATDPLGAVLVLDGPPTLPARHVRIVGVAEAVPMSRLDAIERPAFYLAFAQAFEGHYLNWGMDVVVRSTDGSNRKAEITRAVRAAFPDAAVFRLEPMDDLVAESLSSRRFQLGLMLAFGAVALGLSVVGVAALLFLAVRQEQRELGVYLALGARPRQLWWRVQRQGAALVLAGVAVGIAAALAGASLFTSLVYGLSIRDPIAFVAGPLLLTIAGFVAVTLPAARAMTTDPVGLLRND